MFVSTTQHSLVCNNDHQITSTVRMSEPPSVFVRECVFVYVLGGPAYKVKELVRELSSPQCHPTSICTAERTHFTQTHYSCSMLQSVWKRLRLQELPESTCIVSRVNEQSFTFYIFTHCISKTLNIQPHLINNKLIKYNEYKSSFHVFMEICIHIIQS